MKDFIEVVKVQALDSNRVNILFEDGVSGVLIFPTEEMNEAFEPLRDEKVFRQAFVDNGTITWPGELDLAPDNIYDHIKAKGTCVAFVD